MGLVGATAITNGFQIKKFLNVFKFSAPFVAAWAVFTIIAVGASGADLDLIGVLLNRLEPIFLDQGVYSTNRSYVYEYFDQQKLSFFGLGLGNANIKFGYEIGSAAMPSLLNLFITLVLSTGLIGATIAIFFIAYPIWLHFRLNKGQNYQSFLFLMASYIAWVFMYIMHAEEFSMFFGVIYALMMFYIVEFKKDTIKSAT